MCFRLRFRVCVRLCVRICVCVCACVRVIVRAHMNYSSHLHPRGGLTRGVQSGSECMWVVWVEIRGRLGRRESPYGKNEGDGSIDSFRVTIYGV